MRRRVRCFKETGGVRQLSDLANWTVHRSLLQAVCMLVVCMLYNFTCLIKLSLPVSLPVQYTDVLVLHALLPAVRLLHNTAPKFQSG